MHVLRFFCFCLALAACRPAEFVPAAEKDGVMQWECGQNAESITQVVQVGRSGKLDLELTTNSLCTANAVRVAVEVDGKQLFTDTAKAFPFAKTVTVPKQAKVAITTSVVTVNKDQVCKWLGVVQCKAKW